MAFDISTVPTLADVINANSTDGGVKTILDTLKMRKRPLTEEGYWVRASENTSHELTVQSTRPDATAVTYNKGAPFVNPVSTPKKEQLMRIESNLKIDTRILEKSNDPVKFMMNKKRSTFEGMMDSFAKHAMGISGFGNSMTNNLWTDGFLVRRKVLDTKNCVSLGGTGSDLASIVVVKWGEESVFFIHPKDGYRTIREKDLQEAGKEVVVYDSDGYPYTVLMTNWSWEFGIGVADDACLQRICNIEASGNNSFFDDGTNKAKGEYALIDAFARFPGGNTDNVAIYVGPSIYAQMQKRSLERVSPVRMSDVWGRPMMTFFDVPVLRDDNLTQTEAAVT